MAFIYVITNDINGKKYIGQTSFTIEKRWKEHCQDYKRIFEQRPLYRAMRLYGLEHFSIKCIEETDDPDLREQYWIAYYDTYNNGYNATVGGDGRAKIDRDKVYNLWKQGLNCVQIAQSLNCCKESVSQILHSQGLTTQDLCKQVLNNRFIPVASVDIKTNEIIKKYCSIKEAAQDMINQGLTNCKLGTAATHIGEVCSGKRKTFAKMKWIKC